MKRQVTEVQLNNIKGHCFKKGQSGNPKGRPKNRVKELMKTICSKARLKTLCEDLSADEIATMERKVMQCSVSELQALAKADEVPAYLKTLAMAALTDMKNGRTATMDKMRDRQYGAIKQNMELQGNVKVSWMDALIAAKQEEMEEENMDE